MPPADDVAHLSLPRDRHNTKRAIAFAPGCELPEQSLDRDGCARLVASVFALLCRYAAEPVLAVEVALHLGSSRAGRIALERDAGAPLSPAWLIDELANELAVLPAQRQADRRSNVAISLLGRRTSLSLAQLPKQHDLHFLFHEQPSGLALIVAYDYGAFHPRTIGRMIEQLERSLRVDPYAMRAIEGLQH